MNTPNILYQIKYGSSINFALKNGTFKKLGVKKYRWVNLSSVKFKSHNKRQEYLKQIEKVFMSTHRRDLALTPAS